MARVGTIETRWEATAAGTAAPPVSALVIVASCGVAVPPHSLPT